MSDTGQNTVCAGTGQMKKKQTTICMLQLFRISLTTKNFYNKVELDFIKVK